MFHGDWVKDGEAAAKRWSEATSLTQFP